MDSKQLLWVDPNPRNNEAVSRFFLAAKETARVQQSSLKLVTVSNADEGLSCLQNAQNAGAPFDVVITHWGHDVRTAEHLLQGMRRNDLLAPVIIFSSAHDANARKKRALSLGAQAYCFKYDDLLKALDHVLSPADNAT